MVQGGVSDWLDTPFDLRGKRVWVAGHTGMVGGAVCRRLQSEDCEILTIPRVQLDLREQTATRDWVMTHKPDVVVLAAARVGGVLANATFPAEFLADNLMIQNNVIQAAHAAGVQKLLFLGSSCIYPKSAPQPISEEALMSGPLEPTNEAYATAKIAGIQMCQAYRKQYGRDFISVMPCNLYGPGDRFDLHNSHVIPALMIKAHAAKDAGARVMDVWGSGAPLREFLYVEDLADALVFVLKHYSASRILNIGAGEDLSIRALAGMVAAAVGFKGDLVFDASKPDGVFRKLMDSSRLYNAGWVPRTSLADGLQKTYAWYTDSQNRDQVRYSA